MVRAEVGESIMHPKVSVILPTHNRAEYLRKAIESVLNQTEADLELIIVNDASTDNTADILHRYMTLDKRVKVVENRESLGGGGSRNRGVALSRGKWVAFLDDDDEWHNDKLSTQLAMLAKDPAAVAGSCGYERRYLGGITRKVRVNAPVDINELYCSNVLGGASMCICSKETFLSVGGFDDKLKSGQDWDLWIRLHEQGRILVSNLPLVTYHVHMGDRISSNPIAQYRGLRRLYFKHKKSMDLSLRRNRISQVCFIKARNNNASIRVRLRFFFLSLRQTNWPTRLSYIKSWLPRFILRFFGFAT